MRALDSLRPTIEDQERINFLLKEMGNLIARSSGDPSLPLDWDYWAQTVFGAVTGYGSVNSTEDEIPEVWQEVWTDSEFGENST